MFGSLKKYISKRVALIKYEGIELFVNIVATIVAKILLLWLCMLTIALGSVALALWIGDHYNNYALGFGVITGAYALLVVIFLAFHKALLDRFIKDFLTRSVFKKS